LWGFGGKLFSEVFWEYFFVCFVLGLFGAVALIVSSIGMFNTMTVTLLERTNEIGIMRALGASKSNLRNLFLSESVVIGFLGGVVGTVIGIMLGQIFNFIINSLASKFGGAKTSLFVYPSAFLILIIALSVFIGFLSGIFPARGRKGYSCK
jgi:putative ABC transport system permease protein